MLIYNDFKEWGNILELYFLIFFIYSVYINFIKRMDYNEDMM